MPARPATGLRAALLLALLACGLLPALGQVPYGDPCGSSERAGRAALLRAGSSRLPPPPPALSIEHADAHPAGPFPPAACNYKAIPEPTEPDKYDTANAGAEIAKIMVEAGLELAGEAVGGLGGKAITSREPSRVQGRGHRCAVATPLQAWGLWGRRDARAVRRPSDRARRASLRPRPPRATPAVGLGLFNGIQALGAQEVTPEWKEYQLDKKLYQQTDYLACEGPARAHPTGLAGSGVGSCAGAGVASRCRGAARPRRSGGRGQPRLLPRPGP